MRTRQPYVAGGFFFRDAAEVLLLGRVIAYRLRRIKGRAKQCRNVAGQERVETNEVAYTGWVGRTSNGRTMTSRAVL